MTISSPQENLPTKRISFLDGVRGWASVMVLFSHMLCLLGPVFPAINHKSFKFISDGHLAIFIFFVLSGYALSVKHIGSHQASLALSAAGRYFRLAIPILVISLAAYVLLKVGLFFNQQAAAQTQIADIWIGHFYKFDASLVDAIRFSLFDVFFRFNSDTSYNSILWTMSIELMGSFIIYGFAGILPSSISRRWIIALALACILLKTQPVFACFLFGNAIAEISVWPNWQGQAGKWCNIVGISALLMVALLSTYARPSNESLTCLMAVLLVGGICCSSLLKQFFSNRLSHFLGIISFPLYLVQMLVICSWSSYCLLEMPRMGIDFPATGLIILATTVPACLLFGYFLIPIEKFSIRFSKKMARMIIGNEAAI